MSCKGCVYAIKLSHTWYCDYLTLTGHRRPCLPGEGCTVRAGGAQDPKRIWKENALMKGRSWDTTTARALYEGAAWTYEYAGRLLDDLRKAAKLVRGAEHA